MINYFIINKLGTVLYQSAQTKKKKKNSSISESQRIRYLPLLVIKDLIKANFNNVIQYIVIGNKTVVFKEQQNLLYVACTKKQHLPIKLIQLHLSIMHNFIKFHYGPHWYLHLQGGFSNNSHSKSTSSISSLDIRICLNQLPFLACCGKLSIRSLDALCCIEQVQVGEDLRFKLTENMLACCNSTFVHQFMPQQTHFNNHSPSNRNSFFHHYQNHKQHQETTTTWAYCFLFAREKIIAQCSNNNKEKELSDEVIYFIKLLVSHYLQEKHESGNNIIRTTTLPQNISTSTASTTTTTTEATTAASIIANNNNTKVISPITASSSSNTSSTTNNTNSSASLFAYVYDANSTSTPFKIREKSASSVTVHSSDSYWNQLSSGTPTKALPLENRTPSNVLIPSRQQQNIADILNIDHNNSHNSFLSSSVPSESTTFTTKATALFNAYLENNSNSKKNNVSAPSSPINRSRSQSVSSNNTTSEDSSLKHILSNLINNGESSYLDQSEDVKLVKRWIKLSDKIVYLANIIIILLNDGLCSVIICKDDSEKYKTHNKSAAWNPPSNQVKQFKTELKACLNDFTTFLLTKEATHFTNLSFAVTYPGLVHFVHLNKGVMISPLLVDLNELDKNHELLHEVHGKYYDSSSSSSSSSSGCMQHGKWKWPLENDLKKLCNQILKLGTSCRNDPIKTRVIQESTDKEYYFVYLRNEQNQELLAIYFNIVPPDRLWHMHQKLFHDICQRVLSLSSSFISSTA